MKQALQRRRQPGHRQAAGPQPSTTRRCRLQPNQKLGLRDCDFHAIQDGHRQGGRDALGQPGVNGTAEHDAANVGIFSHCAGLVAQKGQQILAAGVGQRRACVAEREVQGLLQEAGLTRCEWIPTDRDYVVVAKLD